MIQLSALFVLLLSFFGALANDVLAKVIPEKIPANSSSQSTLTNAASVNFDQYQAFANVLKSSSSVSSNLSASTMPEVLVLVSLGMPEVTLGQTLQQAEHYHIPVAIRGLIHDSFRETVEKIFELSKKYHVQGVEINPLWFRAFHVEAVPAFIATAPGLTCRNDVCDSTQFDVINGNISVTEALKQIVHANSVGTPAAKARLQAVIHG